MKNSDIHFKSIFLLVLLTPSVALATGSIGDAAQNLLGPTSLVMKLVDIACYLIGLAFVMMSIAQYKIHRQSPKLVPLATPITLLILGVIALLIPYATKLAETGKDEVKQETKASTLPLPGQDQQGVGLPYPPGYQKETEQQQGSESPQSSPHPSTTPAEQSASPAADPSADTNEGGGSGGWTSDPRYGR